MFVLLEISRIQVKNLFCHFIQEIHYLPKLATDSCLIYFSIVTVWLQHADIWVETQFPFPVFSFLCKDIVESSNFMGGRFWYYCHAASLVLLLSHVCLHTRQFVAVRLCGLTVASMSHTLPAESNHGGFQVSYLIVTSRVHRDATNTARTSDWSSLRHS